MKSFRWEALIMASGLIILGLLLKTGLDNFSGRERIVNVKGLSEMEVPADKVTWPLVFKELGNNLSDLYEKINANNKAVVAFLKSNGLTDGDISV